MSERLLRRREVEERIGLKKSQLYARRQEGQFPQGVLIGNRRTGRWPESEIDAWIEAQLSG